MKDEKKTKKQLIKELTEMRHRVARLEASEKRCKKAEEALRLMKFSVDCTDDAVFLIGPDARFLYVNDASCNALGFSRKELLKMTVHDIDPDFPPEVWPDHWRELKKRKSFTIQSHHRTNKGKIFPVEIKIHFLKFKGNEYNCAFARDISVFEHLEDVLKESKGTYHDLYENAPNAYFSVGSDGHILRCNKKATDLLGYSKEEFVGNSVLELYADTPQGKEKASHIFERFKAGDTINDEELQMQKADGTPIWISLTVNAAKDSKGRIFESRSIVVDINDRKLAEQERAIFKEFVEVSSLAYGFSNIDGSIVYTNPTLCRILGYEKPEDAIGTNVDIYYPNDMKTKLLNEVIPTVKREGGWIGELPLISINGDVTPTIQNVSLIQDEKGNPLYLGNVITDITEREQTEKALQKERDYAQLYLNIADVMLLSIDKKGNITLLNRKGAMILGYEQEELLGKNWFDTCLPKQIKERVKEIFDSLVDEAIEPIEYYENPVLTRSGEERIIAWHNTILRDDAGNVIGTLSSGEDITERKQAEETLSEKTHLLRTLIDGIPDIVAIQKPDHTILFYNQAGYDFLAMAPSEVEGKKCFQLIGRNTPCEQCATCNAVISKKIETVEKFLPESNIWLEARAIPVLDEQNNIQVIIEVLRNITERKKADEALKASEERYRALVESSSDHIFILDRDGTYIFSNNKIDPLEFKNIKPITGHSLHDVHAPDVVNFYYKQLGKVFSTGKPVEFEHVIPEKDFTHYHIDTLYPIYRNKKIWAIGGICRDITQQKNATKEVEKISRQNEMILQAAGEGILGLDTDGKVTFANDAAAKMLGYSRDELIGELHHDKVHHSKPDATPFPQYECPIYAAYKDGIIHQGSDEVFWKKDGTSIPIEYISTPIRQDDEINGAVVTFRDITERKQGEEALKESEEWLKTLFDNAPDAYYLNDLEGTFIDGNKIAEEIIGYKKEELIGHSYLDLSILSHDQLPKALENLGKSAKGVFTGPDEFILKRKNGTLIPVEIQTSPVQFKGKTLVMGIARDITVRKRAEEALRESERRFRTLVENSPMGIWQDDIEQKTVYINRAMLNMLEVENPEDTYGHNWKLFFTTEGLETIARETKKRSGGITSSYELEITGRHGTKRSTIVYGAPLVSSDGIMKGTIATFLDITERKQAEERLTLLKEAIEALPIGITISSTDQKILYVNPAEAKLHGYEVDELTGKDARIFAPQESWRPMTFEEIHEMGIWKRESSNVRKNGETFPVELTSIAVKDISGVPIGIIIACEDITERKRSENELIRAEKLESLSVLASGIAHDFNNMLTIILTSIALAKHYAKENIRASSKLQETEKEILLAKELTNQLLTFSKGGIPVKKLASVSELLEDVTRFSLKGSDLLCEFHFADDLWAAEIDSGQISQVISNIAINSKQAMPSGGIIKVTADNIVIDKENNLPLPDRNYVKISIQDNGIGISEKNIKKIFDPFFTTKEGGTGLGLSSSYSIIKNHHGYIDVASEVGVGTTFDIYLPASEDQEIIHNVIIEKREKIHWRLLLMEDEAKIRENVTELLTTVGYDVETAKEGKEAIQLYKTALHSHQPFHAVLMDLTISGGMGAIECIRELTAIDPDIKAFLMSGYTSSPEMAQFKEYGFKGVIYKPFNIEDVDKTLQEILPDKGE